jgi:hypothetical protein
MCLILYFGVYNLAHDMMSSISVDVERGRFNVTLLWKRPGIVLGCQVGNRILVLCPGND